MGCPAVGNFACLQISEVALNNCAGTSYNSAIRPEALMNISPFLTMNHSCDKTLQWTKKQLAQDGLLAVQTFDLHTARVGLHDCSCPNHGTDECDCQMVILLVYGKDLDPVTLILHGSNGQTWLSISDSPSQGANIELTATIQKTLEIKASNPLAGSL
jgi:hypothetical protein